MDLVECGSKKGKRRHYVDIEVYSKLSESKALCGKDGNNLIVYDAVYFNYKYAWPRMCEKCKKVAEENNITL